MFSLNNFICDIKDVPSDWIFEYYLELPDPLRGQRVRINSIFNPADKTPSMYIYYYQEGNQYRYKCFSTGNGGTAVDLMKYIWKSDYGYTVNTILRDYNNFLKTGKPSIKKDFNNVHWIVSDYTIREWNTNDSKFWLQFNIGSKLLDKYNVVPIASYTMCKKINDDFTDEMFTIAKENTYGYFNNKHELYKLYQPLKIDKKFLKLGDCIQGLEQLEGKRFLVITSSLKDCMAIKSIPGLDIDVVAPDSENSMIAENIMKKYIQKYAKIILIFDNDEPGIEAAKTYKKRYGFDYIVLPCEKDISDTVKARGLEETRNIVFQSIKTLL